MSQAELRDETYRLRCMYQTRKVQIKSDTKCPVCRKPIGTTVFAVFPDSKSVVHYSCCLKGPQGGFDLTRHPITKKSYVTESQWL